MLTLLSPNYVAQPVNTTDLVIAALAWGFTIGFGWLTICMALRQTSLSWQRRQSGTWRSTYIIMIWSEILVCLLFGIICFLHLTGYIPPSFIFYFCILTLWALQVQFLLQIIINRCSILLPDKRFAWRLKVGTAVIITAINITVYNIWVPARLQISEQYIFINEWWDRVEKALYLIIDSVLNIYFIAIVQRNLVKNGLEKYRRLVLWNKFLIGFSLSMDVLIISMMSLPNTFVYMQFHPFAYMVKLRIEMSMADLIVQVARGGQYGNVRAGEADHVQWLSRSHSRRGTTVLSNRMPSERGGFKDAGGACGYGYGYGDGDDDGGGGYGIHLSHVAHTETVASAADPASDLELGLDEDGGAGGPPRCPPRQGIFTTREFRIQYENSAQASKSCLSGSGSGSGSHPGGSSGSSLASRPPVLPELSRLSRFEPAQSQCSLLSTPASAYGGPFTRDARCDP